MISASVLLVTYNIQNYQDDSPADVALSIFETCSCQRIPHLKGEFIRRVHGDPLLSNLPLQKDISVPSPNKNHRNLPFNSQKMVFIALCYLMIQDLFEKYKELLYPGYEHDLWREDILNKSVENKDPRTALDKPQPVHIPSNNHTVLKGIHTVTEDYAYVF